MTENLWWIPLAAGLEDALNPCVLMTCGFLLLYHAHVVVAGKTKGRLFFVFMVFVFTLIFNLGFFQNLLTLDQVQTAIKYIYWVLAVVVLCTSFMCLKDWRDLHRGVDQPLFLTRVALKIQGLMSRRAFIVAMALVLTVLASLWPMNYYMGIFASQALLPGKFWSNAGLLVSYTFIVLWPLYGLWALCSWKKVRPTLLAMIQAAVLGSAGFGIFFILK